MGTRLIVECLKSRSVVLTPIAMVNTTASNAPDHINTIKELNSPSVYIKDKASVNDILDKIIKGGYEKLQVVLDYDQTITKQHNNGVLQPSSFGVLEKCPSVTKEFLEATVMINNKYRHIEFDPSVPQEEKIPLMEQWWEMSQKAIKMLKVPTEEIDNVVCEVNPMIRNGCWEFFNDLNKNTVPILILSAGVKQIIISSLRHNNILLRNVKVVANSLNYDENGYINGFKHRPLIHCYNKNESVLQGTKYYHNLQYRNNAIIAGDSIGDATMGTGLKNPNGVLKIGYLYERANGNLAGYMDAFDIVLVDDQTMHVPHAIIKCIQAHSVTKV